MSLTKLLPTIARRPCDSPLVVAHRGFSAHEPENTIPAIRAAIDVGSDAVEIDVQRTCDGALVVVHDRTLTRTSNIRQALPAGTDPSIAALSLAEIRRCDAGLWKGPRFRGTTVPTLEQVLDELYRSRLDLLLELKHPALYPGIEAQLAGLLLSHPMADRTTVQSFDAKALSTFGRHAPSTRRGLLTMSAPTRPALHAWATSVNPWHGALNSAYVHRAQLAGLTTYAWTVNARCDMRRVAAMGVDAIITDRPARALAALR